MTTVVDVQFFEFQGSRLSYRRFGHGPSVLLTFHGFGQNSQVFLPLEQAIGDRFTIYALDHFYHGESHYGGSQLITKTYWQSLVRTFVDHHGVARFSLLGFSLGGRFALVTAEALADRIDQLLLIAPDGITRSSWYRMATGSAFGRWLFRFFLRRMSLLNRIGHVLTALGLLHKTAMRFAENAIGTQPQREQVYQTWTQFRLIQPDLNQISALVEQYRVRVRIFTGYFDRIVPGTYVMPFLRRLRTYELTVLKAGHNRLIDLVAERL